MLRDVIGDDACAAAHRLDQGGVRAADLGRLDVHQGIRLELGISVAEHVAGQHHARGSAAASLQARSCTRSHMVRRRRSRADAERPRGRRRRGTPRARFGVVLGLQAADIQQVPPGLQPEPLEVSPGGTVRASAAVRDVDRGLPIPFSYQLGDDARVGDEDDRQLGQSQAQAW